MSRIRVELIRRTGCPVVVRVVQGRLVAAGYRPRHPDWFHRLIPGHHRCRRILALRRRKWNRQHSSHMLFADESIVSFYNLPKVFVLNETSADGSMFGACLPTCIAQRWWWVSLGHRSRTIFCLYNGVSSDFAQPITGHVTEVTCPVIGRAQPELTPSKRQKTGSGCLEWYPAATKRPCTCRERQRTQFAWSVPPWLWTAERKVLLRNTRVGGYGLLFMSLIGEISTPEKEGWPGLEKVLADHKTLSKGR